LRHCNEGVRHGRLLAGASAAVLTLVALSYPGNTRAETLREALAAAYNSNPKLDAERAKVRATDEDVVRAESGYQPTVLGNADLGHQKTTSRPSSAANGGSNPWGYSLSVRQSLFNGFRTTNEVSEAEATVKASREDLRLAETNTLLEAAVAYMDVVTAAAVVRIRDNNVDVLRQELEAAKTRRAVKEVTRTDVAQAQARLARAVSTADLAKSELKTSRAMYERVIGHAPVSLTPPSLQVKGLPRAIEEAWNTAEQENPIVSSALHREEAARYAVGKVRGELLPEVSLEASYGHRENPDAAYDEENAATVTGRLSVPLYDGGEIRARVRQAKQIHVSRLQEIEQARADTQSNVTAAWSALEGQRAKLSSDAQQVEANRIALDGVREEQRVGQRTLLDVLNAEQEFLDSQIEHTLARREVVVASYKLLAAMGQLSAEQMGLTATVYDPALHLEDVRQNWFGIDITHADGHKEIYEAADEAPAESVDQGLK